MLYISNFNLESDKDMVKELKNGLIPNPYNILVYPLSLLETNSTIIKDSKVKFITINTANHNKVIKSLEKIKIKVKSITYKKSLNIISFKSDNIVLEDEYINKPLTVKDKDRLIKELNIANPNSRLLKWPSIKRIIKRDNKYKVVDKVIKLDGKRTRVSLIFTLEYYENNIENTEIIPKEFLNTSLTAQDKGRMSEILDIRSESGRLLKWPSIKKIILGSNIYDVEEKIIKINGKRTRVSTIHYNKDIE